MDLYQLDYARLATAYAAVYVAAVYISDAQQSYPWLQSPEQTAGFSHASGIRRSSYQLKLPEVMVWPVVPQFPRVE